MSFYLQLILLFICTFISSNLLIRWLIKNLPNFGMVDVPNKRRAHQKITPRGGGLAVAFVIIVFGPIFEILITKSLIFSSKIVPIFFIISLVSFIDDIRNIPVFIRLIIHLFCSALSIFIFLYPATILHQELPLYLDFILATIGLTFFLNIYNFLDGVDGITAIESIHLSLTTLVICYLRYDIIINVNFIIIITTLICAAASSFLIFNWPPAKIFIGDVGTITIGFLLGLVLLFIAASGERLFASAAIASLYYIADGGLTILIRLFNKEKIWQPHLKHFFQKAVKKGMSHQQVVCRIIICNAFLMLLAINALYAPVISIILAMFIVMITLIIFAK